MKRLTTVLLFSVLGMGMLNAQTGVQINFDQFGNKIEKSNATIQDPKKNAKPDAWIARAELFMDVFDAQIYRAYPGMDMKTFSLLIGKPTEQTQEVVEGITVDKFVMDRAEFYFANGSLDHWPVTKPVVENPLEVAYESLIKAIELDASKKKAKPIMEDLLKLKNYLINEGSSCYSKKDYGCSYKCFSKVVEIGKNPLVNQKDTAIYYYAGLSAQLDGKFEECIPYYEESIKLGFTSEGSVYFNIFDAYKSLGKADEGAKYLEDGFIKYPKNTNVLFSLISYYIDKGEDPSKILVYIDQAIASEPNNPSLFFAKGTLHDRLGDTDEALTSYQKAIEIDPNYFDAYYNIGALFFNVGVKYVEEANKIPAKEIEKYDELMSKANVEFKKSLPYMENALKINPASKEVMDALKNIYFRFRNESPEMSAKYKEIIDKLNNM